MHQKNLSPIRKPPGGWTKYRLLCTCALLLGTGAVPAQDADPPGRVGRVNVVEGQASVQLSGAADWTSEVLNRPLTTGDKLWVDTQSRAELQIGASIVSLGDQTGVQILNLDDRTTQLRLTAGSINVRVRSLDDGENIEVDTPTVAVGMLQPGEYRIDVNEVGDVTAVAVVGGQAQVSGPAQAYTLNPRQRGEFSGDESVAADLGDMNGPDDLDLWAEQRAERDLGSQSAEYVSRDVPGTEDLDENGAWENDPNYGPLWQPRVASVGWAPYHSGHWVWVAPWGWTWVDDESWGFAPFHYGRWVHLNRGWCWSPGRMSRRPVYAPALVAWAAGSNFGASANLNGPGANVAWFALGFNEIYRPAYRTSNDYVRNVNVTNTYITHVPNTTVVNNVRYANQSVPGAVALVPRGLMRTTRTGTRPARAPELPVFARPVVTRIAPPLQVVRNVQAALSGPVRIIAPKVAPVPISVIRAMPPAADTASLRGHPDTNRRMRPAQAQPAPREDRPQQEQFWRPQEAARRQTDAARRVEPPPQTRPSTAHSEQSSNRGHSASAPQLKQ